MIGINYIGTSSELMGCINDTENLANFLIHNNFYKNEEIVFMHDTEDLKNTHLYPTRKNILKQLENLIEFAKSYPTNVVNLFLAYSGHGSYIYDLKNKSDENDHKDEVLCPVDCLNDESNFIIDDEIRVLLNKLPSNAYLTFLCDSCHSGTICDLAYRLSLSGFIRDKHYSDTVANIYVLSGCKDNQTSSDAYEEDTQTGGMEYQGAMTASFIDCYAPNLSFKKLIIKMRTWLKTKGYSQVPQVSSGRHIKPNKKFYI